MQTFSTSSVSTTLMKHEIVKTNKFIINPTKVTPAVNLIPKKQYLIIKGRSCPDNPMGFYDKVYESVDEYKSMGGDKLTVYLNLEYFNTSSAKCLFNLFKKLEPTSGNSMNVTVNWYYEEGDDDMLESGEDYSAFFDFKFNLVPIHLS